MLKGLKNRYHQHRLKRAQVREERHQKVHAIKNMITEYDHAILSWIAPETIKHERGTVWKVVIGIMVLGTIIWGVFNSAWTFSLVVAVFVVAYHLVHLEHPKDVEVKISHIGVKVGARKYPFNRIKCFWIIYDPPYIHTLNIRLTGEIITDLTIQLGTQGPSAVKEVLIEKIPELEGQSEKFSDILLRIFKI